MTSGNGFNRFDHSAYGKSPWGLRTKLKIFAWQLVWSLLCKWTPKPFSNWRLFWFRMFGGTVIGNGFIHQGAIIVNPWNITLEDFTCIGDGATLYALGSIKIGEGSVVAQNAYVCTGSHDFSTLGMPLVTDGIVVGSNVFIGADVFVLPGVTIGSGAVIGARSTVTKDIPEWMVCVGNPCRPIRKRVLATDIQ